MALTPYVGAFNGGQFPTGTLGGASFPTGPLGGASFPTGTLRGASFPTGTLGGASFPGTLGGASFPATLGGPSLLNGGAFGQPPTGGPLPLAGSFGFGTPAFGGPLGGIFPSPYEGSFGSPYGGHHHFGGHHGGDHHFGGHHGDDRHYGGLYEGDGHHHGGDGNPCDKCSVSRRGLDAGDSYLDDKEPDFLHDPDYCRVTRITNFLFLTNKTGLCDSILERLGITLVICVSENHEILPPRYPYCDFRRIPVPNDPTSTGPNIIKYFDEVADLIEKEVSRGGRVLVHSLKGRSRGPTVVIAYLMKHKRMVLCEAFGLVSGQRKIIRPFYAFWKQLITYEKELFGNSSAAV